MPRKYRNPPVAEAACEFRFEPGAPWDLTIPGLIYEKMQDTFPIKKQGATLDAMMTSGPEGVQQQIVSAPRVAFWRQDEKALVQLGKNILSVHNREPYTGWEDFLPLIRRGFLTYRDIAAPEGFRRLGLRYINRIEIASKSIELADYFRFRPEVAESLPQDFGSFAVGIEIPYQGGRDRLRIQLSSIEGTRGTVTSMLDIDYFLDQAKQVALDSAFEWVALAHTHVEEVFEGCITDRLREIFGEVD